MSVEILKMLIQSACSEGTISEQDKQLLQKKASDFNITSEQLNLLITEELNKIAGDKSSSGFVTDEKSSSGFVTEIITTKKPVPEKTEIKQHIVNDKPVSQFSDVSMLDNQGNMSLVQQGKLHGKWIIIKRIKPEYKHDSKFKELFYKEFENAYHLDHPNVIRLLDKGEDSEGAFYTMEYVDGRPLTKMIAGNELRDERLIKKIFSQILDALIYVHKKQIVHRDLKPDNILVTYRGDNVKILDFGLAAADSFDDNLVKVGTPRYAAPEQMTKGYSVDQRADIYAIGLILLEMLTGDITDTNAETVKNNNLKNIIIKCLQPNVNQRFYDCQDIQEWLAKPETVHTEPEIKNTDNDIQSILNQADTAFNAKKFQQALDLYLQCYQKNPSDTYINQQIKKCREFVVSNTNPTPIQGKKKSLKPIIFGVLAVIILVSLFFVFKNKIFNTEKIVDTDGTIVQVKDKFGYFKQKADSMYQAQNYLLAKSAYDSAIAAKPGDSEVLNKIQSVNQIIQLRTKADQLFNAKNIARSAIYYDSILLIIENDKFAKDQLRKCNDFFQSTSNDNLNQQREIEAGSNKQRIGLLDNDGYILVDFLYDEFGDSHRNGLLPVRRNGKWGLIDNSKKLVLPCNFDEYRWFADGYKLKTRSQNWDNAKFAKVIDGKTVIE